MMIFYQKYLKELARQLRNNATRSEIKLWKDIKGRQMRGYDFHRQKPIDNYIVDFYCYPLRLVIELDGVTHELEAVIAKDGEKDRRLRQLGFHVLRFQDEEVMNDLENVLLEIEAYIDEFEARD